MLTITIPAAELFNDETQTFTHTEEVILQLEHSLVSVSKWEQSWEKPFLGKEERTNAETIDYIKCMTISPNPPSEEVYNALNGEVIDKISKYINARMSATWFSESGPKNAQAPEAITSEIMYYWLIALEIPFEVQHWHLNRLLTLVKVVNIKNDPKKKMMPQADAMAQQRMLNEQRKAQYNSKG